MEYNGFENDVRIIGVYKNKYSALKEMKNAIHSMELTENQPIEWIYDDTAYIILDDDRNIWINITEDTLLPYLTNLMVKF